MHREALSLIEDLGLRPHPEGGYFRETYRSPLTIEAPQGSRNAITSIYYLLADTMFAAFHRILSDEIWHFYRGSPLAVEIIEPDGRYRQVILGGTQNSHAAIGAGAWFAAHLIDANGYALVGCDVAPGFEYEDFEIAIRDALTTNFPQHYALIERWTLE